ncbi:efflux RND transporter periplasmic adaptor subunit [Kordiimonas sp. SCSIO 12610]|uniref:efflux RND transporter periplasmic adaptor subunit n=1 Tax=Kordiimonas sp. SCSIO 12610 TaxID=2829597 RepID=UPI00210909A6|nr:efflux RND transporter periplasmic adaptor subunit [Kordiimonas sp. SCSIO 12610]UTW54588.1 efflux RND transporter periplasmic adaptor subunit [Kordiimonas sp. SCSIO 12610]
MQSVSSHKPYSKKWLFVGVVALGIGFVSMILAGNANSLGQGEDETRATKKPVVEVAQIIKGSGDYTLSIPGRLRARSGISLVGEVAGKITYVDPRLVLGGRFQQGEILVEINKSNFEAEVARAQAVVASSKALLIQAKADTNRRVELYGTGAVTEAQRDQAVANLASSEASLKQAEAQLIVAKENLSRATIVAPFPALVIAKGASLGGYVSPGQELAQLIDIRAAELIAGVSPQQAATIAKVLSEKTAELQVLAKPNEGSVGTQTLVGRIDNFSPVIDTTSRSALIVAVFPDAFAKENTGRVFSEDFMTLEIAINADANHVWQVPYGALRRDEYIWLVDESGILQKQTITVLSDTAGFAMIRSEADLLNKRVLLTALSEEREGIEVEAVLVSNEK